MSVSKTTVKTNGLRAGRPSEDKKAVTLASLADKGATVRVNVDLERGHHRALKMLAANQQRSVSDILREAIQKLLTP